MWIGEWEWEGKGGISGGQWFEAYCNSHLPSPWTKVLVIIRMNCEGTQGAASLVPLICILPMGLPGQRVQYTIGRRGWGGYEEGTHSFPWKWIFMPLFCRGYDRVDYKKKMLFIWPALAAGLRHHVADRASPGQQISFQTPVFIKKRKIMEITLITSECKSLLYNNT